MRKAQKWVILPDLHIDYHDKLTMRAVEKYEASTRFDGWLQLGDLLDFNEISNYVIGKPGSVKERVDETFEAGVEFLERQRKILGRRCRMVVIEGNHDYRAVDYALRHPEMGDLLNVPRNLQFKRLGIEWVPFWSRGKIFRLGNANFIHGHSIRKQTHAKITALEYGSSTYYGHTHDVIFSSVTQRGHDKTIEAGSLGCLCEYNQKYMKGSPTNWQQAVSTMYLQPNGNYNLYVSRIFNHKFTGPDGVLYG